MVMGKSRPQTTIIVGGENHSGKLIRRSQVQILLGVLIDEGGFHHFLWNV